MKISKLAPSKRKKGRWLCYLEDGSILRMGEDEIARFGLYTGMELTGEQRRELEDAVRVREVRMRALGQISMRPLSRKELIDKLMTPPRSRKTDEEGESVQGASEEEAAAAADWLESLGYLDDAEYARALVRRCAAKGCGERKMRDELWKHGVPRELWEEALRENTGTEETLDTLLRAKLKGGTTPDRKELQRIAAGLARRGFSWSDINDALRRYGADTGEDETT